MLVTVVNCRRLLDRLKGEWLVRRLTRSSLSDLCMWLVILALLSFRPCGLHVILLVIALVNSRRLGRRTMQFIRWCNRVNRP